MGNDIVPSATIPNWARYAAAGIGGLALGIGDYLRHGNQSTVRALEGLAGEVLLPWIRLDMLLVVLIVVPILGAVAAWIQSPSTKQDAFALGLAAFSVFGLIAPAPLPTNVVSGAVQVSAFEGQVLNLIASAHAQEPGPAQGGATVKFEFEGKQPAAAQVSITNLTQQRRLGLVTAGHSLALVGNEGDLIELDIEAPGHRRTRTTVPLGDADSVFKVDLQENRTPLFLQRLIPADTVAPIQAEPAPGGGG